MRKLKALQEASIMNGMTQSHEKLAWLDQDDAMRLEPNIRCTAALLSPDTGVMDAEGYIQALEGEVQSAGGEVVCHQTARSLEVEGDHVVVEMEDGYKMQVPQVVNATGLHSVDLMNKSIPGIPPRVFYYAKGNYMKYTKKPPFEHLIYPLPQDQGLGVHVTLDAVDKGVTRFGPDVEWVDKVGYVLFVCYIYPYLSAL